VLLPGTVLVLVPWAIVTRDESGWPPPSLDLPLATQAVLHLAGFTLASVGLWLFVWTVSLFGVFGKGTLGFWDAPRHLVVQGPYRHVRNPMMCGVLCLLAAEVLLLGSVPLLKFWLFFLALNLVVIPAAEEPLLLRKFGEQYRAYKQAVPRWIPRRKPWTPPWLDDV
jgi:protein-S-isoprenylcysteine O-methyltransferase Ste14